VVLVLHLYVEPVEELVERQQQQQPQMEQVLDWLQKLTKLQDQYRHSDQLWKMRKYGRYFRIKN
jgi:hypothetical protein